MRRSPRCYGLVVDFFGERARVLRLSGTPAAPIYESRYPEFSFLDAHSMDPIMTIGIPPPSYQFIEQIRIIKNGKKIQVHETIMLRLLSWEQNSGTGRHYRLVEERWARAMSRISRRGRNLQMFFPSRVTQALRILGHINRSSVLDFAPHNESSDHLMQSAIIR